MIATNEKRDLPPVRPQIVRQPAHQARVVGFTKDVIVVPGAHDGLQEMHKCGIAECTNADPQYTNADP